VTTLCLPREPGNLTVSRNEIRPITKNDSRLPLVKDNNRDVVLPESFRGSAQRTDLPNFFVSFVSFVVNFTGFS
jgi:hypothetical protein